MCLYIFIGHCATYIIHCRYNYTLFEDFKRNQKYGLFLANLITLNLSNLRQLILAVNNLPLS